MSSGQARPPVSPVLVVASEDVDASRRAYELLLGVDAGAPLTVENATIELRGGTSEKAPHRALFGTVDFAATTRLLRRRGLALTETSAGRAEADAESSVGVIEAGESAVVPGSELTSVDHLVFNSADRDGAVALFGATLGMDFRLEQSIHDGIHQLFFRAPTVIVEVVVGQGDPGSVTTLWGVAWKSADIDRTHHRLVAADVPVSEMRTGRKAGTRVFSVRDHALGLPTLVID
ncbi:UNVERIFIED_CONTAM: hypothetical protein DES50_102602 [Williamsia faeni]